MVACPRKIRLSAPSTKLTSINGAQVGRLESSNEDNSYTDAKRTAPICCNSCGNMYSEINAVKAAGVRHEISTMKKNSHFSSIFSFPFFAWFSIVEPPASVQR